MAFLAGCSLAADVAGLPRSGLQPDGRFVLGEDVARLDCRGLRDRIESNFLIVKRAAARVTAEKTAPPPTLVALYERASGGIDGGSASARTMRVKGIEIRALDAEMKRKTCPETDVEARLREITGDAADHGVRPAGG